MEFRVKTSTASKVIGNNLNRNIVEFRENEAEYVCKGAYYLNRNIVEFRVAGENFIYNRIES